ncbi:MAG TPA: type II secretion system F family protein [Propionibacteriaceae bacterium]|nr:type II secretion system F family protein [Propionibacteriaceae bacterium]
MPWTIIAAIILVCLGLSVLTAALVVGPDTRRVRTLGNLSRGMGGTVPGRVATSRVRRGQLAARLTPQSEARGLNRLLARAGRPPAWPLDRVIAAKFFLTIAGAAIALLLVWDTLSFRMVVVGGAIIALMHFLPEILLYNAGVKRREAIQLELADTLDQMSIAVEAGLGFDAAMVRVARNGKGVLAKELVRTLQDIQVGQSRREAYEALSERTNVPDLRRFIRSIVQAEQYGLALATVLHTQADELRVQRRQNAEEKAMKIPVKVVFPLIVCIMPALFIVIIGPAVINIAKAFGYGG